MTGSQNNPLTTVTSNSASFGPLLYDDHAGAVSVSSRHSFVENFVKQSIKWKICPRDLRTFYEDNRKNGDSPIASPAAQDDSPPYKPTSTLLSPNEWTCLLPPLPKHVPADAALNPLWSPRSRYRVGDYVKFRDNGNYYVYTPGGETVKDMTQQQRDKELSREAKDARRDRQAGKDRQASKDRQAAGKASKRGFGNTGNAGNKRAPATTTTMAAEAAASGYALTSSTLDSNLVYDVQTKQWVLSLKKSEFMGMSFFLSVPAHLIKHYETLFVKGVQKGVDKIIGGDGWVVKVKGFKCDETEGEEVTEGKSKIVFFFECVLLEKGLGFDTDRLEEIEKSGALVYGRLCECAEDSGQNLMESLVQSLLTERRWGYDFSMRLWNDFVANDEEESARECWERLRPVRDEIVEELEKVLVEEGRALASGKGGEEEEGEGEGEEGAGDDEEGEEEIEAVVKSDKIFVAGESDEEEEEDDDFVPPDLFLPNGNDGIHFDYSESNPEFFPSRLGPLLYDTVLEKAKARTPRVIAIGDVHGCIDELQMLLRECDYRPGDQVVFLGDLCAKGPDSLAVVQMAREIGAIGVRGNHDFEVVRWHQAILNGVQRPPAGPKDHYSIANALSTKDLNWLTALPWFISSKELNTLFVHAGFVNGIRLKKQNPRLMMNMRSVLPDGTVTSKFFNNWPWARLWEGPEFVLFGHDADRGLQKYDHALGIDTGCVYGGRLTACILPERRLVSVAAKKEYFKFRRKRY